MIALESYMTAADCLGTLAQMRADVLKHMAADLAETGAFKVRGDAVRQLHHDGYKTVDIMILVDEAIYACMQDVIAKEFCAP